MKRADLAEKLFREGYNCAQTVFCTYKDVMNMKESDAAKLVSTLGAGFGKLREVCGAASGMSLVLGAICGYSDSKAIDEKKELYQKEQKLMQMFKSEMGSYICRELLNLKPGEDLKEPAVRDEDYYKSRPCIKACRVAAEILQKELNIKDYAI